MYSANINACTRVTFADKCRCSDIFRTRLYIHVYMYIHCSCQYCLPLKGDDISSISLLWHLSSFVLCYYKPSSSILPIKQWTPWEQNLYILCLVVIGDIFLYKVLRRHQTHIFIFLRTGSPIFAEQLSAGPDRPHIKSLTHVILKNFSSNLLKTTR